MKDWNKRLAGVDDEYLAGLSNKGILKRACKDMAEAKGILLQVGEEASLKIGGETVTIRFPLGESTCTCPSRTMCRHRVHGILVLKEYIEAQKKEQTETGELSEKEGEEQEGGDSKILEEIKGFPIKSLKAVLGQRRLQVLANQIKAGTRAEIIHSSIITVHLPAQEAAVKLLSPLEYSACTCHKKELCSHKAEAILWCKLEAGVLKETELAGELSVEPAYKEEQVQAAAGQMKEFLEELFNTGLSRISPDVLDHMERLAIISHNAKLAVFEGYFRALADSYHQYFRRSASFQPKALMKQTARLYRQICILMEGDMEQKRAVCTGEFRAEYHLEGLLDLIGITLERFWSQSGYEGETIYFLEEHTGKWYTYTNARPVFYEQNKKRRISDKTPAPWGIPGSIEDMANMRIRLTGAKADNRGRLSASQETKGEVTGERKLKIGEIEKWYYEDFKMLFLEQISENGAVQPEEGKGMASLVFVAPHHCLKTEFSETGQQFSLPLYDKDGREIIAELAYSKRESESIRYLEKLIRRVLGKSAVDQEQSLPCFLGRIYLRDSRLRLYPVALIDKKEISDEPL